jgi:hypothetical protein
MAEVIEIQFDEEEGHLHLDCDDEKFGHIRDLVVSEASVGEKIGPYVDTIRFIGVRRIPAIPDAVARPVRRGIQMLLVCLVLAAALVIQAIGIVSIVQWLLGRAA